jgi:hypothetical protein
MLVVPVSYPSFFFVNLRAFLRTGRTWAVPLTEILMGMMAGGARAIFDGNYCGCWIDWMVSYLLISTSINIYG